jgi:predicted dehydrogenase
VLVEKPLGLDAAQAEEVAAAAAAAGVFCMEAMWTLFLPRFDVVRQVLDQGMLGDVRTVLADHGERFDPPHRILDPAMAGGSLLDLGSYLTALATWTLGPAQEVFATGEMTPGGVNGQAAMVLTHGGGARSVLHTTLLTRTPTAAACTTPRWRWRCGWRRESWSRRCARRPASSPGCGPRTRSAASSGSATTRQGETAHSSRRVRLRS